VVGAVLVAAGVAVYRQRRTFGSALRDIGVGSVLVALLLATAGVAVTYAAWRQVLKGLAVELPVRAGARVFFISQLGKYLPGSVWPVVMQMEAGRARGASRRTMLAGNLVSLVLALTIGLLVAAVTLPFAGDRALQRYWWLFLALPFLIALLHPRAVPWLLDKASGMLRRPPLGERLAVRNSLAASGWSLASFVLLGLHLAVLTTALSGWSVSTVVLCIGTISLAMCAGVLFVPAPAGAGVRDIIVTLALGTVVADGEALAIAVTSRALLIVSDLLMAAVAAVHRPRP
jgi:hypothetical protein